jgi:hypothetical protein
LGRRQVPPLRTVSFSVGKLFHLLSLVSFFTSFGEA